MPLTKASGAPAAQTTPDKPDEAFTTAVEAKKPDLPAVKPRRLNPTPFERFKQGSYSSADPQKPAKGFDSKSVVCTYSQKLVYEDYYVSRHGLFTFMDGAEDESGRVWGVEFLGEAMDDNGNTKDNVVLCTIDIHFTDDDPLHDDVIPLDLLRSMRREGGEIKDWADKYEAFWSHAVHEHKNAVKEEATSLVDSVEGADMSVEADIDSASLPADTDKTPAAKAAEHYLNLGVTTEDVEGLSKAVGEYLGEKAGVHLETTLHRLDRRATDHEAADMSVALPAEHCTRIHEGGMSEAYRLVKQVTRRLPTIEGVIATGVKHGVLSLEAAGAQLADLYNKLDDSRRIQGVMVETVRPDRWKIALYCREAEGRVVTPHVVHVTPGTVQPEYRITGSRKYPHHLEILDFIEKQTDSILSLFIEE